MEQNKQLKSVESKVLADLNQIMEIHKDEPFHNVRHPEHVGEDALAILGIFREHLGEAAVSHINDLIVKVAAAGHDTMLYFTVMDKPEHKSLWNYRQRVRHRGFGGLMPDNVKKLPDVFSLNGIKIGNEELSWLVTLTVINRYDPDHVIFTESVLDKIRNAIAATYPDPAPLVISPDHAKIMIPGGIVDLTPYLDKDNAGQPTVMMFHQPFLTMDSDITTLAVAFGDLMYAGCCDAETFRVRGNQEFRELRDVLKRELAAGISKLPFERRAEIAKDAIGWLRSQVGFLLGQKIRFYTTLHSFQDIERSFSTQRRGLKVDLIGRYSQFDANLVATVERYSQVKDFVEKRCYSRQDLDELFINLMKEMGYSDSDINLN